MKWHRFANPMHSLLIFIFKIITVKNEGTVNFIGENRNRDLDSEKALNSSDINNPLIRKLSWHNLKFQNHTHLKSDDICQGFACIVENIFSGNFN